MNVSEYEAAKENQKKYYGLLWEKMIESFNSVELKSRFFLINSSGYLFTVRNCRFAMDLQLSTFNGFSLINTDIEKDLEKLQFFFLTHEHSDHFDKELIKRLSHLPIKWIVPDFFATEQLYKTGIKKENLIIVKNGDYLRLGSLRVLVFSSSHFRQEGGGCDEYGYYIDTGFEKLLFPGDVRTYDPKKLPTFERIDAIFSHIWFGSGKSDDLPCEPKLSEFCDFALSFNPKRIYLTHLYQLSRSPSQTWGFAHAGLAISRIYAKAPQIEAAAPKIGDINYL